MEKLDQTISLANTSFSVAVINLKKKFIKSEGKHAEPGWWSKSDQAIISCHCNLSRRWGQSFSTDRSIVMYVWERYVPVLKKLNTRTFPLVNIISQHSATFGTSAWSVTSQRFCLDDKTSLCHVLDMQQYSSQQYFRIRKSWNGVWTNRDEVDWMHVHVYATPEFILRDLRSTIRRLRVN